MTERIIFINPRNDTDSPVTIELKPKTRPRVQPPRIVDIPQMSIRQALAIAALVLDFEREFPHVVPPPPEWEGELIAARQIIRQILYDTINPPAIL